MRRECSARYFSTLFELTLDWAVFFRLDMFCQVLSVHVTEEVAIATQTAIAATWQWTEQVASVNMATQAMEGKGVAKVSH